MCMKSPESVSYQYPTPCRPARRRGVQIQWLKRRLSKEAEMTEMRTRMLLKNLEVYMQNQSIMEENEKLRQKAMHLNTALQRRMENRNLATYFIISMKEGRLIQILHPQLVQEAAHEQLLVMAELVKKCLNMKGEDRPTMKEVATELEGLKRNLKHPWDEHSYLETTSLRTHQRDLYPVPSNAHPSTSDFSGQYSMQNELIVEMSHPR